MVTKTLQFAPAGRQSIHPGAMEVGPSAVQTILHSTSKDYAYASRWLLCPGCKQGVMLSEGTADLPDQGVGEIKSPVPK